MTENSRLKHLLYVCLQASCQIHAEMSKSEFKTAHDPGGSRNAKVDWLINKLVVKVLLSLGKHISIYFSELSANCRLVGLHKSWLVTLLVTVARPVTSLHHSIDGSAALRSSGPQHNVNLDHCEGRGADKRRRSRGDKSQSEGCGHPPLHNGGHSLGAVDNARQSGGQSRTIPSGADKTVLNQWTTRATRNMLNQLRQRR